MKGLCPLNKYVEYGLSRWIYYKYRNIKKKYYDKSNESWILIICRHPLGDTVVESSFIKNIANNFRDYKIFVVCSKQNYNLLEKCPYIDKLVIYDSSCNKSFYTTNLKRIKNFAKKNYFDKNFEYALIPSTCMAAIIEAWLAYFSGADKRIAYSENLNKKAHNEYMGMYDKFFSKILVGDVEQHEILSNNDIVKAIKKNAEIELGYYIWTDDKDTEIAQRYMSNAGIEDNKLKVIVNLSTSQKSKDWPIENYINLCNKLLQKYNIKYILIGAGEMAGEYADEFCKNIKETINFVNKTTIRETAEIMRQADFYLGGDTEPTHMAMACDVYGIAIYKSADDFDYEFNYSKRLYPMTSKIKMLNPKKAIPGCEHNGCDKNYAHCIKQISIDIVYKQMIKIIEDKIV